MLFGERPATGRGENMMGNALASRWLMMAVVYFVIGIGLGIHMGKTSDFVLAPVHAHINLLGWVSMAIFAIIYHIVGNRMLNRLAALHFWLYQIGVPVMLVTLAFYLQGNKALEPVVGVSSIVVGIAVLVFAVNALRNGLTGAASQ